eukprot:2807334-Prymnesium_polylepis.2
MARQTSWWPVDGLSSSRTRAGRPCEAQCATRARRGEGVLLVRGVARVCCWRGAVRVCYSCEARRARCCLCEARRRVTHRAWAWAWA